MAAPNKPRLLPEFAEQPIVLESGRYKINNDFSEFDELLLEAVDEALSFLGESAKRAIYYHLEEKFKIRRWEIPRKLEEFTGAIENIFGIGAKIIEIQIMRCLYKRIRRGFKYELKEDNLSFNAYLKAVRKHFMKKRT